MNSLETTQVSLDIIYNFIKDPIKAIRDKYNETNIDPDTFPILLDKMEITSMISGIDRELINAIDILCERLDNQNIEFVHKFSKSICIQSESDSIEYSFKPIECIGLYIPYRMPSSAYTFLSAAKAAGVKRIMVYLPVDLKKGKIDELSIYVANKYNATILRGPAVFAFPTLAFGVPNVLKPCDKIFGPCSNRLNLIKQLAAFIAQCDTDMCAGSSELAIIADDYNNITQIEYDLLSQLEHGDDCKATLLIKNDIEYEFNATVIAEIEKGKISVIKYTTFEEGIEQINKIAPETLVVYTENVNNIRCIKDRLIGTGVCYFNCSNSLGDYGVIGRGCADPTNGFSKSQSGVSPLLFMKNIPFVISLEKNKSPYNAGMVIVDYEKLKHHKDAMTVAFPP